MSAPRHSNSVGGLKPKRNLFDLSYSKLFDCDYGKLIPVMCDEVVPGDYFKIGAELVVRFQPLAAPVMHKMEASLHYFFVPYRLLFDGVNTGNVQSDSWENFIKQGFYDEPTLPIRLPYVDFNTADPNNIGHPINRQIGSLWDYFGFPVLYSTNAGDVVTRTNADFTKSVKILKFPWRAYNFVYNEYYRDDELQAEVPWDSPALLFRNWKKDYFTVARTRRQAGQAAGMPVRFFDILSTDEGQVVSNFLPLGGRIAGIARGGLPVGTVLNPKATTNATNAGILDGTSGNLSGSAGAPGTATILSTPPSNAASYISLTPAPGSPNSGAWSESGTGAVQYGISDGFSQTPDEVSGLATFDVADLRLAFQLTKWLERNERAGKRYTTFLVAHFGVSPSDARLDRPEYIGGAKMPVVFSEVLQTSETVPGQSQLGTMGGHGLAASGDYIGSYNVQEFGLIIGLLSVMAEPVYQHGVNRQWTRELPIDFYFPEFSLLSEQAIHQYEIFAGLGLSFASYSPPVGPTVPAGVFDDKTIFGFIPQYDEMRTKQSMVCANMRRPPTQSGVVAERPLNLAYWHLARQFVRPPLLNTEFISSGIRKDIFLAPRELGLIVHIKNKIRAARPLPLNGIPGLVDHN